MKSRQPKKCETCDRARSYSEKRDAYFCEKCDRWLEGTCGGEDCIFCPGRKDKPSEDH